MCGFCGEFSNSTATQSRIIWQDQDFILVPTLGCLRPGYCLLMPRKHTHSYASIENPSVTTALQVAERIRAILDRCFGQTILAEHGPGLYSPGASCCDHAHLHLIPVPGKIDEVLTAYKKTGGEPKLIASPGELAVCGGEAYLLLSIERGQYLLWDEVEAFPPQFIRRVVARILGIEEKYDWTKDTFPMNMLVTKNTLGPLFVE